MEKLRIALIDDEPDALNTLKMHIERAKCYDLVFMTTDPEEGLQRLENGEADVLITDILMDKMDGIMLASFVEKLNIPVIICSAFVQYGYDGFKVNAVDFLKKPVEFPELIAALKKIKSRSPISNPALPENPLEGMMALFEHGDSSWTMITISEIQFIKQDKNYSEIYTLRKKHLVLGSLKSLLERLPRNQFQQIHRSFLVNIQMVRSVKTDHLVLSSGEKLAVGRVYSKDLISLYKKVSL